MSKENFQSMSALSTAHKPFCVTPSVTLMHVWLKDKIGALSMTAPVTGLVTEVVPVTALAAESKAPHALKKPIVVNAQSVLIN